MLSRYQTKERYTIELDDGATRLGLRQTNLTQILTNVKVVGIESRPEFNVRESFNPHQIFAPIKNLQITYYFSPADSFFFLSLSSLLQT